MPGHYPTPPRPGHSGDRGSGGFDPMWELREYFRELDREEIRKAERQTHKQRFADEFQKLLQEKPPRLPPLKPGPPTPVGPPKPVREALKFNKPAWPLDKALRRLRYWDTLTEFLGVIPYQFEPVPEGPPPGFTEYCNNGAINQVFWWKSPGATGECIWTGQVPNGPLPVPAGTTIEHGASGASLAIGRSQLGGQRMTTDIVWRSPIPAPFVTVWPRQPVWHVPPWELPPADYPRPDGAVPRVPWTPPWYSPPDQWMPPRALPPRALPPTLRLPDQPGGDKPPGLAPDEGPKQQQEPETQPFEKPEANPKPLEPPWLEPPHKPVNPNDPTPPHGYTPPRKGQKEQKWRFVDNFWARWASNIFGNITEAIDLLEILWEGLPKNVREKYAKAGVYWKAKILYDQMSQHPERYDLNRAMWMGMKSQLEEIIVGQAGQFAVKGLQNAVDHGFYKSPKGVEFGGGMQGAEFALKPKEDGPWWTRLDGRYPWEAEQTER